MVQDDGMKLFKYIETKLQVIERKLDEKASKKDMNRIAVAVDGYAKKAEAYMLEMLAISSKVDRLERWANKIANKRGTKLEY